MTSDRHATPDRAAIERAIRTLKDRDCPYLGNFKLGYDSALDDLLNELWGDDD